MKNGCFIFKNMNIGYACLALGVLHTDYHTCRINNANKENLITLIKYNLTSFENIIDYNIKNDLHLFRISSDLIPFGSNSVNSLLWWDLFKDDFNRIGEKIRNHNIRVSCHPGQYTVINSPSQEVVNRAFDDLIYHERILSSLGTASSSKIVLHIGGIYGNKEEAKKRFVQNFLLLPQSVKQRLIIENDDKSYNIEDVLEISEQINIPVVFDNLHHFLNPPKKYLTDQEWINLCKYTWKSQDGNQKIHYSEQDPIKKAGSHSFIINPDTFIAWFKELKRDDLDVMLEVKDKNISAIKITHCLNDHLKMRDLEKSWEKYKYKVLEMSPKLYLQIRQLLKDKQNPLPLNFYRLVDFAINQEPKRGHEENAIMHIWGYFKHREHEKIVFQKRLERFREGSLSLNAFKNYLFNLALEENIDYLLQSYFFAF
ncbi:MAG: UV DNA damage repair endonuclease UvsE [Bacilli bacterium]